MAATDHPLKRLVSTFIGDFATWILNSPVRETHPLNVELPAVVARLRQVPDPEARGRLLTALLALLLQEDIVTMVEKLLEDDTLLLDTPYLRRIREAGREEGILVARRRSIVAAMWKP
jgi:hypothetical protein